MRKLIFLLTVLPMVMLSSCSKDDEILQSGFYQIINEMSYESEYSSDLNGTMYDCVVAEYDKNKEFVEQKYIGDIKYKTGKSEIIEASTNCDFIMITFYPLPDKEKYESLNKRWVIGEPFKIIPEQTTIVRVTNHTPATPLK